MPKWPKGGRRKVIQNHIRTCFLTLTRRRCDTRMSEIHFAEESKRKKPLQSLSAVSSGRNQKYKNEKIKIKIPRSVVVTKSLL